MILPRFKDYSYILLLIPTYFMIGQSTALPQGRLMALILVMFSAQLPLPGFSFVSKLWGYYPYFLTLGVFALYVREILSMRHPPRVR